MSRRKDPPAQYAPIDPRKLAEARAACVRLEPFVQRFWSVLHPNRPLVWGRALSGICEFYEAVAAGEIMRGVINCPPGLSKTSICSILGPCWELATSPGLQILGASVNQQLADDINMDRRKVALSRRFSLVFPHDWTLREDVRAKYQWETTAGAVSQSIGALKPPIGTHYDRIILDDPQSPAEMYTVERDKRVTWLFESVMSRRTDVTTTRIFLIQQRLDMLDLTAALREAGWDIHVLPMEFVQVPKNYRLSRFDWRVKAESPEGTLLFPERFPRAEMAAIKRDKVRVYQTQFQQDPADSAASIFRRAWFGRRWTQATLPLVFDEVVSSWDCAGKAKRTSDYVVGQVWGRSAALYYLLHEVRGQLSINDTEDAMLRVAVDYPECSRHFIEDAANGAYLLPIISAKIPGVIGIDPKGKKEERAYAWQPAVQSGNVIVPASGVEPWADEFIEELVGFPTAAHDDRVDAAGQAVRWFMEGAGGVASSIITGGDSSPTVERRSSYGGGFAARRVQPGGVR